MINLNYILFEEHILYNLDVEDKNELLRKMSEFISSKDANIKKEEMYNELIKREKLESTGIINKIALPHCFLDNVGTIKLYITILKKSINFNSFDNERVKAAFFIIADTSSEKEYIQVLSSFAYLLKEDKIKNKILSAESPKKIVEIIASSQNEFMKMSEVYELFLKLQKIEYQILYYDMEKNITKTGVKDDVKDVEKKIKELKTEKAKLEKKLTPYMLDHYNKLKKKYGDVITARIQYDNTCGYCSSVLPLHFIDEVKKGNQIIICSNCGKILYI